MFGTAGFLVFAVHYAAGQFGTADQWLVLSGGWLGAFSLSFGMTFGLSGFLNKRLSLLTVAVEAIKARGDLSVRLNDRGSDELSALAGAFDEMIAAIQKQQTQTINSEKDRILASVASQVAHDVRSPLTALETVLANTKGIEEEKRVMIRTATKRIKDIANHLLEANKTDGGSRSMLRQRPYHVGMLVEAIVSEKRVRYADLDKMIIESVVAEDAIDLFLDIDQHDLKRVLSNLIDNAVDSYRNRQGNVLVELHQINGVAIFKIEDTGTGIHPAKLKNIMGSDLTGQGDRFGIGLSFVRKKCAHWRAEFILESTENTGTVARLKVRSIPPPAWFISTINIREGYPVIIADDDPSIHLVWGNRLAGGPRLLDVNSIDAFEIKVRELKASDTPFFCLVDYEFVGSARNGIDAIKKLDISACAVLVTSRHDEEQVNDRCLDLRIKMIPKGIAPFIPIRFVTSGVKYVFLDDDPFITEAWEIDAATKKVDLTTFSDYQKLLAAAPKMPNDTLFYLDHNLGGNVSGIDVAKKLQRLGFKEIFLSTGYDPENFKNEKVIKGVFGKEPPF